MTFSRFLWIPQGFFHLRFWVFALLNCFISFSPLQLSSALCSVLSELASFSLFYPEVTHSRLVLMKCDWSCRQKGVFMQQPDKLKSNTPLASFTTWRLARLSLVTVVCESQSLHTWCLLSASTLPTSLPASCFPCPFRSSIYPSLLCRLISHNKESHPFSAKKNWQRIQSFSPLFLSVNGRGQYKVRFSH